MKAVVAAFNQEKVLVGAFSVITNLRMKLFKALLLAAHPENSHTLQSPTPPRLSCCTLMARVPWSWLGPATPATAATSPVHTVHSYSTELHNNSTQHGLNSQNTVDRIVR